MKDFYPEVVILADGDYPNHPIACELLKKVSFVACCDGAVDSFVANGGTPRLIVGDGDSISDENRNRFSSIIIKISSQETNDLTKTVTHLKSLGHKSIAIVGATGKREDHTLGNISLLLEYMAMGLDVRMYTDYGVFIPANGNRKFESFPGQQVSIFNFGAKGLNADGLKYPLRDFSNWWQGTLNESTMFSFFIHATGQYITFLSYHK